MSDLREIEKRARDQAGRHYRKFMDECTWEEMLEKYADISNQFEKVKKFLVEKDERGARLEASDFADVEYYGFYYELLAKAIADNMLVSEGYVQDKRKNWVLKNQSVPEPKAPAKKKFGLW